MPCSRLTCTCLLLRVTAVIVVMLCRQAQIGPGQLGLAGGALLFGLVFLLVSGGDFAPSNRYKVGAALTPMHKFQEAQPVMRVSCTCVCFGWGRDASKASQQLGCFRFKHVCTHACRAVGRRLARADGLGLLRHHHLHGHMTSHVCDVM